MDRVAGVESGRLNKSVAPRGHRTRRHTFRLALLSQNRALLPTQSFVESRAYQSKSDARKWPSLSRSNLTLHGRSVHVDRDYVPQIPLRFPLCVKESWRRLNVESECVPRRPLWQIESKARGCAV